MTGLVNSHSDAATPLESEPAHHHTGHMLAIGKPQRDVTPDRNRLTEGDQHRGAPPVDRDVDQLTRESSLGARTIRDVDRNGLL